MNFLEGKRLLVVSGDASDIEIVKVAKELGLYVICCDGHVDWGKSPAKKMADEAWDIDYSKTELVAQKCMESKIDGVIAGYSEERVLAACRISNAIGTPFYASETQINLTRNKRAFKKACSRHGIKTPREFCIQLPITDRKDVENVKFPVIVKPADNGGRKGITICNNLEQLLPAVAFARENSKTSEIEVEEYIEGVELSAIYTISNGKISLSCLNDKYVSEGERGRTTFCDFVVTPSMFYERFLKECDAGFKELLREFEIQNGVANFQLIANDNGISAFEMGFRVNGNDDFKTIRKYNNIDFLKMLISYSVSGDMGDDLSKDDPRFPEYFCTLVIHLKPGIIKKIDYKKLSIKENITEVSIWKSVGDRVLDVENNTHKAGMIKFTAHSYEEMADTVRFINENLTICDTSGDDMRMFLFNPSRLPTNENCIIEK